MLDLLKGTRIISFNHFLMGPMGVQYLADLGADVIAVETLEGAWQRHWSGANAFRDEQSMLLLCANRNKRSIALDLRNPEAKDIALKLVKNADVVMENFRPGVMDRLGLGYETLKALNPSLIYAAATGYGPDGPYVGKPGQDLLVQALYGLMAITGSQETGPRPVGVSAGDHHGAALFAMGVLAALVRRGRTGQGCRVDATLMHSVLDLQAESLTAWLNMPKRPVSVAAPGHVAGWYYPAPYGVYATEDAHLAISLSAVELLAEAMEEPRIADFKDDASWDRRDELQALVAKAARKKTNSEWMAIMDMHAIWHAPVNDYAALVNDPQVKHAECFVTVKGAGPQGEALTFVNHPLRYDGKAAEITLPPQPLGMQTEEILTELGYKYQEIEALEKTKATIRYHAPRH
jgi:crotonobetainyl-CoA:carnitine CoA-transferase CaiB-like acyl-CoA transferase